MFGVKALAEDMKWKFNGTSNSLTSLHDLINSVEKRAHERIKEVEQYFAAITTSHSQRIDRLTRQIQQLAKLSGCKITPATPATSGGEVKKMTEEELELEKSFENLFFPSVYYGTGFAKRRLPETMTNPAPKKKKKPVKKKK